ncbi:carboxy terminal-processing peptidase [Adhaeribacter sp. BT258]|uniref:Carboxy terminal-processing peptidase n=2 Tax=Adhaeribacter terrigena TaxID=2793070 RepID=A0ABS1BXE4_9BACT|nr:carboxy terminal-processing peptidase [Adhaeribacter terrigena]
MMLFACYTSHSGSGETKKDLSGQGKNEILLRVLMQGLNSAHFQPEKLDDNFSKKVYGLYLKRLDFNKKFLLQTDIDKLQKYQTKIDDHVQNGSYEFLDASTRIFNVRSKESQEIYKDILAKPFDFNTEESTELDPEKLKFPKDKAEQREAWRKYLKYQTLVQMAELIEMQEKAQAKKDNKTPAKTNTELEAEARKKVLKTYDDMYRRISQFDRNDSVSAYINAIANAYDPHTEYFPPKDKASFDIAMTGRLEGIGATLSERDGYIKVAEIVPGSASYRQGELKAGDIILKVAQGNEEPVSVEGMRLDNAVQLVRGKKGTEVRLTVKKPDASVKVISIIRDIVIIEETYAQSALINAEKPVGYIKLPGFYADFDNKGGRNSADDVRKEVEKLKKQNIQGLILDLRNNGGGSLQDAVQMAGLFFERGPVVQVETSGSAPTILEDRDPQVQFDGPLVIMVNQFSASASEILAAAMQDYKRGVVVGSANTFGKGTVQQVFNLDNVVPSEFNAIKPLGSLKLTTQKFYRVNGGATQLRGVAPDILLPDMYTYLEQGEKDQDFPLPWDEIKPASFKLWKDQPNIAKLKANSTSRVAGNANFKMVTEIAQRMKQQSDNTNRSLKLTTFMAENKKSKEDAKRYEEVEKGNKPLNIASLKVDTDKIGADTVKQNINTKFIKNLSKDIYLSEATNIIKDQWAGAKAVK